MKQIKIDDETLEKLPGYVNLNGEYFTIVWSKHRDGMNFSSLRLGPEDLKRIVRRGELPR